MAERIIELLSDDEMQERMSEEARKNSERFSIEKIGIKWEQAIEMIMRGNI